MVVFQMAPGSHFVCLCIPKSRCDLAFFGKRSLKKLLDISFYRLPLSVKTSTSASNTLRCVPF